MSSDAGAPFPDGPAAEELSADFITEQGYRVIARNFRYGKKGEIDIIARNHERLLFIEVRARQGTGFGGPLVSISAAKIRKITATAKFFLQQNRQYDSREIECRFDVIAVTPGGISWHRDAFRLN